MVHELPDLPYAYDALEPHIDAKTMEIHHGKHHAGYVKKLNSALEGVPELQDRQIEELLKDIESVPEDKKQAVINNGGGHANHSLFWEVMTAPGQGMKPADELMKAMVNAFGSGEGCHKKFVEAAVGHFGSGWVWIIVNKKKELEIIATKNQDSPLMEGKIPILGLDVWEHAYYLKYQNRRPEYVEAFVKVINWDKVSELYGTAKEKF